MYEEVSREEELNIIFETLLENLDYEIEEKQENLKRNKNALINDLVYWDFTCIKASYRTYSNTYQSLQDVINKKEGVLLAFSLINKSKYDEYLKNGEITIEEEE